MTQETEETRVAEQYDINDIKTFQYVNVIEKYDGEKHDVIKCATLVENQTGLKHYFIPIWVIAIYLNEAKPYTNKTNDQYRFFPPVKIELQKAELFEPRLMFMDDT